MNTLGPPELRLGRIETTVCEIPTDRPEADGTKEWNSTTVVFVEVVERSGLRGLGWSYCSAAAAQVVQGMLAGAIASTPLEHIGAAWQAMVDSVRNIGRPGVAATAISAVDIALWDLNARALGVPVFRLLGPWRASVPIYGSGGFTSYSDAELIEQLGGWVGDGIPRVKMKIGVERGNNIAADLARIHTVRKAIGPEPELFVDANGAYTEKEAIHVGRATAGEVSYFEEPVSSDQLVEMESVRRTIPQSVAAGEYGYDPWYFDRMLRARAVDILQADATRCLGITGFLAASRMAQGAGIPFSAHTSPAIHAHAACAAPTLAHVEYFHDHVRIEGMLLDGAPVQSGGRLHPDWSRPGLGVELKRREAERYRRAA